MSKKIIVKKTLFLGMKLSVLGGLLGVLTIAGAYLYFEKQLPSIDVLEDTNYQEPLRVYTKDNKLFAEFGDKRRVPKKYKEIPRQLVDAFVAAEDNRYWGHFGIDLIGAVRAAVVYIKTGKKKQGASTITMQVARNFFLTPEKSLERKIKEMFLAVKIELKFSKEKVLELYLNKIYLGKRSYGIAAAAQIYYKKTLEELTLPQMAMMAGLPKAPSAYNPIANPKRAKLRRDYVLGRMYKMGVITNQQLTQALATDVTAKQYYVSVEAKAPYVAEMVRAEMVKLFPKKAYTSGFKVYTTIDSKLQKASNIAVQRNLINFTKRHGYRGPIGSVDRTLLAEPEKLIDGILLVEPEKLIDGILLVEPEKLIEILNEIPKFSEISPAVVIEIADDKAKMLLMDGNYTYLGFEEVQWAREKMPNNKLGAKITKVEEVLNVADIVYLNKSNDKYELAQLPKVEGSLVAISPQDGQILSLSGGFDFHHSKFNRVTQAIRQVGSNFKPFLYSSALNKGYTAATIINDAPVVFNDPALEGQWKPQNYSGRVYGPTRLRKALINSRNLVSIRILLGTKITYTRNYARRFGFSYKELPKDLSLSLGSGAVSPLKLVTAYAILANGGYRVNNHFISHIEDRKGQVIYRTKTVVACSECDASRINYDKKIKLASLQEVTPDSFDEFERSTEFVGPLQITLAPEVIDPRNAFIMKTILKDVVQRGTARRARVLKRKDLAGKTGTTNDQHDAWFTGFNNKIVATAWVGFDRHQPLGDRETGSKAALPMWIDYMQTALNGMAEEQLAQPKGVVSILIDKETGEATSGRKNTMFEYFRTEFAPKLVEKEELTNEDEIAEEIQEVIEDELF